MSRGRPRQQIADRIRKGYEVEGEREHWIWKGDMPAQLTAVINGRKTTIQVVRYLFDPNLHPSNRPFNMCGMRKCINPEHYKLRPHHVERWGDQFLPPGVDRPPEEDAEREIDDLHGLIASMEPRPTPEQFYADNPAFAFDHIREAYRRIAAE